MNSIRIRLFLILLTATGAVWLSAFLWIQQSTRAEVERVLDARLAEAGQMVSSLISDRRIDVTAVAGSAADMDMTEHFSTDYAHRLSCQIWSFDGALVGRSASAPAGRLSAQEAGFSTNIVDGEEWRVYSVINETLGMRVMVGDSHTVRDRLVRDVTTGLVLPALLILPLLAGLIWLALRRGLRPLEHLAKGLAQRSADDLSPVAITRMPREISPVGTALNGLFSRVEAAREREKAFTAFAAHELKTPLAGIKTQAQVAGMAPDAATRKAALAHIQQGVDRTDRMLRQLLSLASVEGAEKQQAAPVDIALLLHDVAETLTRTAAAKNVMLAITGHDSAVLRSDPVLLTVALRNVIENAITAAPEASTVEISIKSANDRVQIRVLDRGPGIAEAERTRITDRFFRGAGAQPGGSGLGLAIVEVAINRLGGQLCFAPRAGGGEAVSMVFPHG